MSVFDQWPKQDCRSGGELGAAGANDRTRAGQSNEPAQSLAQRGAGLHVHVVTPPTLLLTHSTINCRISVRVRHLRRRQPVLLRSSVYPSNLEHMNTEL
jgi:hypothetical protein